MPSRGNSELHIEVVIPKIFLDPWMCISLYQIWQLYQKEENSLIRPMSSLPQNLPKAPLAADISSKDWTSSNCTSGLLFLQSWA